MSQTIDLTLEMTMPRVVAMMTAASQVLYVIAVEATHRYTGQVPLLAGDDGGARLAIEALAVIAIIATVVIPGRLMPPRDQRTVATVLGGLRRHSVVSFALIEAACLLGVITWFACGARLDFYVITAVGLLLMVIAWPTRARWAAELADVAPPTDLAPPTDPNREPPVG